MPQASGESELLSAFHRVPSAHLPNPLGTADRQTLYFIANQFGCASPLGRIAAERSLIILGRCCRSPPATRQASATLCTAVASVPAATAMAEPSTSPGRKVG